MKKVMLGRSQPKKGEHLLSSSQLFWFTVDKWKLIGLLGICYTIFCGIVAVISSFLVQRAVIVTVTSLALHLSSINHAFKICQSFVILLTMTWLFSSSLKGISSDWKLEILEFYYLFVFDVKWGMANHGIPTSVSNLVKQVVKQHFLYNFITGLQSKQFLYVEIFFA